MQTQQVTISVNGFEIIDADVEFYAFLGNRDYFAFDRLIESASVAHFLTYLRQFQLDQQTKKVTTEVARFFMHLISCDDKKVPYICWFEKGASDDIVRLKLIEVNQLVKSVDVLTDKVHGRDVLLSLYNDIYFEYEVPTNLLSFCRMEKNIHVIAEESLEKMEELLLAPCPENYKLEIKKFISSLRNGDRQFGLELPFNVNDPTKTDVITVINGMSIYEDGMYAGACGYLHLSKHQGYSVNKVVGLDSLTGVMNKAEITSRAIYLIDTHKTPNITLAIVDVDYFKNVNDTFGHLKGDEVLKTVADIMEKSVGANGVVGRIGGDEFMIIFYNAYDMENMRECLKSLKNNVRAAFPPDVSGEPSVTLSIGCAGYPKDADNYEDTFMLADFALYRAKEKGRDRYIIYDIAKHGGLSAAKTVERDAQIVGRGSESKGDVICRMIDAVITGQKYPVEKVLDDFIATFDAQRIVIYSGNPKEIVYMAGESQLDKTLVEATQSYVNFPEYGELYEKTDEFFCNDTRKLENKNKELYDLMVRQHVTAVIQFRIPDKFGVESIISFEMVHSKHTWNKEELRYYRIFANLLRNYKLTVD